MTSLAKRVYVFNRVYDSSGNGFSLDTSGMQLLVYTNPRYMFAEGSSAGPSFNTWPPVSVDRDFFYLPTLLDEVEYRRRSICYYNFNYCPNKLVRIVVCMQQSEIRDMDPKMRVIDETS